MRLAEIRGRAEQRALTASIAATSLVAAAGVLIGLATGSFAILFDGVYTSVDAAMSGLSLLVARLILRDALRRPAAGDAAPRSARFQFGYWHFEPMVLAANGLALTFATLYALGGAVLLLLDGGRTPAFDLGIVYAALALAVCLGFAAWERRINRVARSELVALDVRSWLMSAAVTGALLVAFAAGAALEGGPWGWAQPYVDPGVLALVSLAILPLPFASLRDAARDIFGVAPEDLDAEARAATEAAARRHGFADWRSYVARAGRAAVIEIHLVAPGGRPMRDLAELDAIREEIGEAIGGGGPNRWLTVAFTTRPEFAE